MHKNIDKSLLNWQFYESEDPANGRELLAQALIALTDEVIERAKRDVPRKYLAKLRDYIQIDANDVPMICALLLAVVVEDDVYLRDHCRNAPLEPHIADTSQAKEALIDLQDRFTWDFKLLHKLPRTDGDTMVMRDEPDSLYSAHLILLEMALNMKQRMAFSEGEIYIAAVRACLRRIHRLAMRIGDQRHGQATGSHPPTTPMAIAIQTLVSFQIKSLANFLAEKVL